MNITYFDRLNKNKKIQRSLYKEIDDVILYDYKNSKIEIKSSTNSIIGNHLIRLDDIVFLSEEFVSDVSFKRYGYLSKGNLCNYNDLYKLKVNDYSVVECFDCSVSNFKRKKLAVLVAKYDNYYLYDCDDGYSILENNKKYEKPTRFKNAILVNENNDNKIKILFLGKNGLCEKRICFLDKI